MDHSSLKSVPRPSGTGYERGHLFFKWGHQAQSASHDEQAAMTSTNSACSDGRGFHVWILYFLRDVIQCGLSVEQHERLRLVRLSVFKLRFSRTDKFLAALDFLPES